MTRLLLLTITMLAFTATASADTLTLTATPNGYSATGEATSYNTVTIREESCQQRSAAKGPILTEQKVAGSFIVTGTLPVGKYQLCAYLYAVKTEPVTLEEKLQAKHYPEPCRELYTPPAWCQEGNEAGTLVIVEAVAESTIVLSPSPVPEKVPIAATPAPASPTPVGLVSKAGHAKPRAPICKRHPHRRAKCKSRRHRSIRRAGRPR